MIWRRAHPYGQKGRYRLVTSIRFAIHSDDLDDGCDHRRPLNNHIDTCERTSHDIKHH